MISDNTATYGGGIYTDGDLTVQNSTLNGNTAIYGSGISYTSKHCRITLKPKVFISSNGPKEFNFYPR